MLWPSNSLDITNVNDARFIGRNSNHGTTIFSDYTSTDSVDATKHAVAGSHFMAVPIDIERNTGSTSPWRCFGDSIPMFSANASRGAHFSIW
jgi:hypothetical protein